MVNRQKAKGTIHFLELNAKAATLGNLGLVFPKYGTTVLASRLRDECYHVRVFLEGVSQLELERIVDCDVLCLPVFAPALTKVQSWARRVRSLRPELPLVMGGPQVCFFPETVVQHCDVAVRCEGDEVLLEIIEKLQNGESCHDIAGVSYVADSGAIIHNPEPPPPEIPHTIPDLELIEGFERATRGPFGGWNVVNTLQTSRGCRFRCKFCPTRKLFQGIYRNRDMDAVIADIRARRPINRHFFVVDNDFCCDKKKTQKLLERIIDDDLDISMTIFERHEIGRDAAMLDLLKRAGVEVIIVGVESLLDESLADYDKEQKREDVLRSIQNIRDRGIHVLTTFVLGGDNDTPATATALTQFINETGLSLNLFILQDLEEDTTKDLIIPLERRFPTYWKRHAPGDDSFWDYGTGSFALYFPKRMKPSTLQRAVLDINADVFTHRNILRNVVTKDLNRALFSIGFGYGMRQIHETIGVVVNNGYMDYLERIEDGLYDENEVLIEERLLELESLPLPEPMSVAAPPHSYAAIQLVASLPGTVRYLGNRVSMRLAHHANRLQKAFALNHTLRSRDPGTRS